MIRVFEHESFESALAAFQTESKSVLRDAKEHDHFTPDRAKQHRRAKSAGGNHRKKKPGQGKRRY